MADEPLAPETPRSAAPAWRRAVPAISLAVLAIVVYHNGLTGAFVFDDQTLVEVYDCADHPLKPLRGLLLLDGGTCGFRPLRYLSYSLDRAVFGDDPVGYHVVNLGLHVLCVLAVFGIARRLLGSGGRREALFGAWLAAAVFAVHPVNVDAVTYISGRRDLLTTLLFLAGVLEYLRYRAGGSRVWAWLLPPTFYLAVQSKEMAVTLPAVLIAIDALMPAVRPETPPRRGVLDGLRDLAGAAWTPLRRHPLLFGAIGAIAVAFFLARGVEAPVTHHPGVWGGSRLANTATALGLFPKYFQLLAWPATLLADYSPEAYPIQTTPWALLPLAGAAILLALAAAVIGLARRAPVVAIGAAWFAISITPVMHFIPHHELFAEHYLYLPSIGAFLAVGFGAERLRGRLPVAAAALAALVIVPLGIRTLVRNPEWRDERSLLESELSATDDCARVHFNYAGLLLRDPGADAATVDRAARHLLRAYQIQLATKAGVARVPVNEIVARLGSVAARLGNRGRALELLRDAWARALRHPRWDNGGVYEPYAVTLLNLGGAGDTAERLGFLREALPVLDRWIEDHPAEPRPRLMRGRTLHLFCEGDAARRDYAVAIERGDEAQRREAAELTVESLVGEGDAAGALRALEAARQAGTDSERLRAYSAALASGDPLPTPRCPRPGTPESPAAAAPPSSAP